MNMVTLLDAIQADYCESTYTGIWDLGAEPCACNFPLNTLDIETFDWVI